jgi:RHS repeat-associated protein
MTDHLGSIRDVVNASGSVVDHIDYDAFGNISTPTNAAETGLYTYAGMQYDANTGLYYDLARYYNPQTQQWTSQDPLGFDAGDSNLYRYVNNQPANRTDPSGLRWSPREVGRLLQHTAIGTTISKAIMQGIVNVYRPDDVFAWTEKKVFKEWIKSKEIWGAFEDGNDVYIPSYYNDISAALAIIHEGTHAMQYTAWEDNVPKNVREDYNKRFGDNSNLIAINENDFRAGNKTPFERAIGSAESTAFANLKEAGFDLSGLNEKVKMQIKANIAEIMKWEFPAYRNEGAFLLENNKQYLSKGILASPTNDIYNTYGTRPL